MKKHFYLLLPLLTPTPSMAMWSWFFGKNEPTKTTKKIITSTIITSTLMISHSSYDKKLSLRLHQAVEQNNTTNALQLITNPQVDIHAKVDYGTDSFDRSYTPLLQCCKTGDEALKIAQALLKHKHINVNLQDKDGFTPLIGCVSSGDKSLKIAQALLKHKHINVNLQDKDGFTPLIGCVSSGDKSLKIAQELLKHQHINVNLQDENGYTPLDIIIYWIKLNKENYKYVQLWKLLVEQGAVLKQCTTDYQNLKPSDFKDPHRTYIDLIKQNPPKNLSSKKQHTPRQTHPNTYL